MRPFSLVPALVLLAPFATAQNCFDGSVGTLIATDPQDVVLPIQAIGFPFPLNGQTWTDVHITDHGFVQLSNAGVPAPASGAVLYTPIASNFVAGSPKIAAMYGDVIGTGGGRIHISSSPTKCTITWGNMQNFGFPSVRFDFQMSLFPNGDVRLVFGPNMTNNSTWGGSSDNAICGITPGNNATLPVPSDLSAGGASVDPTVFEAWTLPQTFDLANTTILFVATNPGYTFINLGAPANCGSASDYGTGCGGLAMTSVGLPTLGNSSYAMRILNIPAISPVAFVAFGDTVVNPGIPLDSIGMAGCSGYTNLNLGLFTSGPVASGVSDFVLAIPAAPAIVGTVLASQGVALSGSTTLGLIASNGVQINVGYGH